METKKCECGCGQDINKFDKKGREMRFVFGHHNRVKNKHTPHLIECACGCGETLPQIDERGRYRKFISGHQNRAKTSKQIETSRKNLKKYVDSRKHPWNKGLSYTFSKREEYANRGSYKAALVRTFGDKCMACGWDKAPCDAHHISETANGGKNSVENGIILCPNCHRLAHTEALPVDKLQDIRNNTKPLVDRI